VTRRRAVCCVAARINGAIVFTVILCSVVVGALAGLGYWFFSRLVDGWGLEQHGFLPHFDVNLFGFTPVDFSDSLMTVVLAWYGYMAFAPVVGAAAGAVMSLLAIDARRGLALRWLAARSPIIAVAAAVLATATVTTLFVYPIVPSFLLVAYIAVIGGAGLLFALLCCARPAPGESPHRGKAPARRGTVSA
jgi:hypothetical protein